MKFIFRTLGYLQVIFTQVLKNISLYVPKGLKGIIKCIKHADCIFASRDSVDSSLLQTLFLTMSRNNNEFEFLI